MLVSSLIGVLELGSLHIIPHDEIRLIIDGLMPKIVVNIQHIGAVIQGDDAVVLLNQLVILHDQLTRFAKPEWLESWFSMLTSMYDNVSIYAGLRGWATAILLSQQLIDAHEAGREMSYALSAATQVADAAEWLARFVRGRKMLPFEVPFFMPLINQWLLTLEDQAFRELLPVLRKAFSTQDQRFRRGLRAMVRNDEHTTTAHTSSAFDAMLLADVKKVLKGVFT